MAGGVVISSVVIGHRVHRPPHRRRDRPRRHRRSAGSSRYPVEGCVPCAVLTAVRVGDDDLTFLETREDLDAGIAAQPKGDLPWLGLRRLFLSGATFTGCRCSATRHGRSRQKQRVVDTLRRDCNRRGHAGLHRRRRRNAGDADVGVVRDDVVDERRCAVDLTHRAGETGADRVDRDRRGLSRL